MIILNQKKMKNNNNLLIAYERGYRIIDGKVIAPSGNEIKADKVGNRFRFKIRDGKKFLHIYVARLLAYQIYGDKILKDDVYVYHINGNPSDNSISNIKIGTFDDAQYSKHKYVRKDTAMVATKEVTKYNHSEIIEMRRSGMTYEEIMEKTGIKSKGSISYICKKSHYAKEVVRNEKLKILYYLLHIYNSF